MEKFRDNVSRMDSNLDPHDLDSLYAILGDRERPYFGHRLAV